MIKILHVEDNLADAELVADLLQDSSSEAELQHVQDAEQAWQVLWEMASRQDACLPQLIMLDIGLPRMSGLEFLNRLKQHPRLKSIPVVVLSTSDAPTDLDEAYQAQAASYVVKSADLTTFEDNMRAMANFWLRTVRFQDRSGG